MSLAIPIGSWVNLSGGGGGGGVGSYLPTLPLSPSFSIMLCYNFINQAKLQVWFRDCIIPSDSGLLNNVLQLMVMDKKRMSHLKGSIFAGCYVSHVAFIQAIKVDLILLLYRFETNTTSEARCPKCCWLSLPSSLWCLPSISQPGSH